MMKILFLTSRLPFPPVGGDKLRTFNFIKYLKKKHRITLLSFIEKEDELDCISEYQQYFDRLVTIKLTRAKSYRNCLLGIASDTPLQIHYYYSAKMQRALKKELQTGYDIIFSHLIRMAQYLPDKSQALKVVDFTDAISLNYQRSKPYRKGWYSLVNAIEARRVRDYEYRCIDNTDRAVFISQVDADYLKNEKNAGKIVIIPNGVDLEKFAYYKGEFDPNQICFVGNMRTFPNTDAVLFFVNEIFPLLKQKKPELKFYIVGAEPNRDVLNLHNGQDVLVSGYVDSVIPYITKSVLTVAPMRVGAGVQNKILEALALGTPVVSTSIGAEGLDNSALTIGDTSREIANSIANLIDNPALREFKSRQGRQYIEANFRWDNVLTILDQILV